MTGAASEISRVRPKVVACDLDGTLLRSDGTVDERTRRAIARVEAAGSLFVLCTARPTRWMRPLGEALGHRGVAICANGGVVWDLHTESVVEAFPLEPAITRDVIAREGRAARQCLGGRACEWLRP